MAYNDNLRQLFNTQLQALADEGIFKMERYIHSVQDAEINVEFPAGSPARKVINICSNNYLGLSSHRRLIAAAHKGLDSYGFGMSSVRFICGTQDIHRVLEQKLSEFLKTEDTILFPSCLDANAGVFEALLGADDVIIADRLIHASLIDGIRLSSAATDTFKHSDMRHLQQKLILHQDKRIRLVVTDGVFSMDGDTAHLDQIAALCEKHHAMLLVDDSHATGFIGAQGRGTHEKYGVEDKVDLITTTFGKGLGGASGGCVSGRRELIELCRQKARPYLFSNTVAPPIVAGVIEALDLISESTERIKRLMQSSLWWRNHLQEAGFSLVPGDTPIVPVMLGDAKLSQYFARDLFEEGVYAIGFFFPVVPKNKARIRTQISAAHQPHHLEKALDAFIKVGKKHGVI